MHRTHQHPGGRPRKNKPSTQVYSAEPAPVDQGNVTGDHGIYISPDGLREIHHVNVRRKKRRLDPEALEDSLAQWTPVAGDDGDELEPLVVDGDEPEGGGSQGAGPEVVGVKRKRYASWDYPMAAWRPEAAAFLLEILRHEGLSSPSCASCGAEYTHVAEGEGQPQRLFRCSDCVSFSECLACCLRRHQMLPLHRVQEWSGEFWTKASLGELGLVFQLGHSGLSCPYPEELARKLVVIDLNGLHTVRFRYCDCATSQKPTKVQQLLRQAWYPATVTEPHTCATFNCLDTFRLLNVVGNVNIHDFVGALERKTDAVGLSWVPDRYKSFGRMARQYAFLQLVKRAGRMHEPSGLDSTQPGECAVECWACPQEGKNLPEGWRDVKPSMRFLYMLVLAVDANFRLKNRIRKNEHVDLPLGDGWSYFVPEKLYKAHLKNYVAESDVSTCIAFAALLQKDTKITTGLRCSGVGACICARHELLRPQGIGDLQKGERYSNMDFIFLSSIIGVTLLLLLVSYDIVCQWKIHLRNRMNKLPQQLQIHEDVELQFGLPVWHAAAHERSCQAENTLTHQEGAARVDGEGIERFWHLLNPSAFATKEMSEDARRNFLNDKIDFQNFLKNILQGTALPRKLVLALDERARQVKSFHEVDSTLSAKVKADWQKVIDRWQKDRKSPNPYILETKGEHLQAQTVASANDLIGGLTEASVRLVMTNEEVAEAAADRRPLHGASATAFLTTGLQLEDTQRKIRADVAGATFTEDRERKIQERRLSLLTRLKRFRRLQHIYMPGAVRALAAEEEARDSDSAAQSAEDIKLWLPSELDIGQRVDGCAKGLPQMEAKLREAQCNDALTRLRSRLHAKQYLINFRNANSVGQSQSTRSQTLIRRVGDGVRASATKYRQARWALVQLEGASAGEAFRELLDADLTLDGEHESDAATRKKLGRLGTKAHRSRFVSNGKKVVSWIWTANGAPGSDDAALHEAVRVEWSKAKARKARWEEEVLLLREEMRRVLRYLDWDARRWTTRAETSHPNPALAAGLRAYALRQADLRRRIGASFKSTWDAPREETVRALRQHEISLEDTFMPQMD